MDVDLAKLNHLLVIARTGSFSRAAEELRITQPALSRSVAALEQRFGFRIFERGRGGAAPTAVGALVLADAEALLRDARSLEQNLHLYARGEAGKVAFGMGPLIASLTLRKLAAQMMAARPQLQIRCSVKSADVLLRELADGEIEMLFCATEQITRTPEIAIQPLQAVTLAMIVRAGHPLAGKTGLTLADVVAYPIAHSAHAAAEELHAESRFARGGALFCDNYEILRQVVLDGDAVWMSSPQMVADDLAAGRLALLDVADIPARRSEIGVVRLKGRTSSPAASAVTACVAELIAG
ncbi:LysR family transcriptional regulator [Phenylobacterium sp. LjRoot219]|uniref:LysR family transcriptional regulator n=1 Tax=Phenylobacterium sp. LjRoot219 TaxID=3342283 RepID=UPI003ECC2CB5